jgi:hypothetical protein
LEANLGYIVRLCQKGKKEGREGGREGRRERKKRK